MHLTREHIDTYCLSLLADERSAGTISKYRRDLTAFARWLERRAVNGFCRFAGLSIKLKFLSIQRQIFRDSAKKLTKEEYDRLLAAARESD